jgi:NADPH:quinone reductase-like Zn-dependent oxidoreductase
MIETSKLHPVVEKTYPLSQVPEAMTYLGTGHVKGKLVITI